MRNAIITLCRLDYKKQVDTAYVMHADNNCVIYNVVAQNGEQFNNCVTTPEKFSQRGWVLSK